MTSATLPTSAGRSVDESRSAAVIRRILLAAFLLGLLGTAAELLFMDHMEDWWQRVPLIALAAGFVTLVWHFIHRRQLALRVFQGVMIVFMISGIIGMWLHYSAKMEFKLEGDPGLRGMALFWESLQGVSPPALAPGSMIPLGLVGLAYAYRHPVLWRQRRGSSADAHSMEG
jgi:hypothetical protein